MKIPRPRPRGSKWLGAAAGLAVTAVAGSVALAAPASAEERISCRNIGNGDVCVKIILPMYNGRTDVTTWYTKRSGSAVQVRLGYYNNGYVWDDGPFWINAGEIRGYTWFGSYTADVCVTGEMLVMATNSLIPGGTVCP